MNAQSSSSGIALMDVLCALCLLASAVFASGIVVGELKQQHRASKKELERERSSSAQAFARASFLDVDGSEASTLAFPNVFQGFEAFCEPVRPEDLFPTGIWKRNCTLKSNEQAVTRQWNSWGSQ